jgi:hypothetical protein
MGQGAIKAEFSITLRSRPFVSSVCIADIAAFTLPEM